MMRIALGCAAAVVAAGMTYGGLSNGIAKPRESADKPPRAAVALSVSAMTPAERVVRAHAAFAKPAVRTVGMVPPFAIGVTRARDRAAITTMTELVTLTLARTS